MMEQRGARKTDAAALAFLINEAGDNLPAYLWSLDASEGQSPLDVGEERAIRETGGFSYRNAHVLTVKNEVVAMLLGYVLPDPYDVGDLADTNPIIRPLIELEAMAPGSWYINAIATFGMQRGKGLGSQLMALAEDLAETTGCSKLSLIVASENDGAKQLYLRLGYKVAGSRSLVDYPGCPHGGDWLLMVKG
jgi:ribosomal protein S18 acetylase RimI-like enzyme